MLVCVKRSEKRGAELAHLECDQCGVRFTKYMSQVVGKSLHFHSRECQRASLSTGALRVKTEATNVGKYGSKTPAGNADVQAKTVTTNLGRFGVRRPTQSPTVQEKQRQTCVKNHGVEWGVVTAQCREASSSAETVAKRHETMKRNGTYRTSRSEDAFYDALCAVADTVERQPILVQKKRWRIDFYVKNVDTYVQFDGVYWHGLDRPLDVIALHVTKRDAQIHGKWLSDRRQDAWFHDSGLRLIRVTDVEFRADPSACLLRIVGKTACHASTSPRAS